MRSQTSARAVLLSGIVVTCLMVSVGGLIGAFLGGPGAAGLSALTGGCAAALGAFLARRRSMAKFNAAHQAAHDRGFAEGLAHGLLLGMVQYEAAVFPSSPDGVTAEERDARRTYAYRIAAQDALPETIRLQAARVLAALDEEERDRAREAMQELSLAVREQEKSTR
jgi:F0F1-type ATP synthase assembly protein I